MIIDARQLAAGANLQADVCVVGAGAAGITLALELAGRGLEVIVLESGGYDDDHEIQDLYAGTMSGIATWQVRDTRTRRFGGTTARWAGWSRPLEPDDFEPRAHVPLSGWPIRAADLEPYYPRTHELLELGPVAWAAEALASREGLELVPAPGGLAESRLFRFSPPTRFGTKYRAPLEAAADVVVILHANAVDLATEQRPDAISQLHCASLRGPRFTVEAERYVLATGGLENPRLLLASTNRDPAGVANGSGMVGRCFMEHPHMYGSAAWLVAGDLDLGFYERHRPAGEGQDVTTVLALSRAAREAHGLLDLTVGLREVGMDGKATGEIPPSTIAALTDPQGLMQLTVRAEQSPYPASAVTLSDDLDALGTPRIDLRWAVDPEDLLSYRRSLELLGRELGAARLGRVWMPLSDGGAYDWKLDPGSHHIGTTRMSVRPDEGVVDADCRCHEVDNLYLAGSSVFTTGGSANPTFTIVALAVRLAEHLAGGTP